MALLSNHSVSEDQGFDDAFEISMTCQDLSGLGFSGAGGGEEEMLETGSDKLSKDFVSDGEVSFIAM
jgi:hypothetical protein